MQNKRLKPVIVVILIAMLALIGVQVMWIRNAMQLRHERFSMELKDRLDKVCKEVTDNIKCIEFISRADLQPGQEFFMLRRNWKDGKNTVDTIPLMGEFEGHMLDEAAVTMQTMAATAEINLKFSFYYPDTVNDKPSAGAKLTNSGNPAVDEIRKKLWDHRRLADLIPFDLLDSLLNKELNEAGIDHFGYTLYDHDAKEILFSNDSLIALSDEEPEVFKAQMFGNSQFQHNTELRLTVPDINSIFLRSVTGLLIISGSVILLLLLSFWYFVRTALKQKKMAEIRNDFISNMTHEFKTPIANISLAVETIAANKVLETAPRVRQIVDIIGQENNRMHENVKRIMQVALYDRDNMSIERETVSMHELIASVVKSIGLRAEQTRAEIRYDFKATRNMVEGDITHLTNIVFNLLDNALKYKQGPPRLLISSYNKDGLFVLKIRDNGRGISSADQKLIFEKFFRVSTGNVHDVKGFGLGLAYVKSVVEAHGGSVHVESEPGKGSVFITELPVLI